MDCHPLCSALYFTDALSLIVVHRVTLLCGAFHFRAWKLTLVQLSFTLVRRVDSHVLQSLFLCVGVYSCATLNIFVCRNLLRVVLFIFVRRMLLLCSAFHYRAWKLALVQHSFTLVRRVNSHVLRSLFLCVGSMFCCVHFCAAFSTLSCAVLFFRMTDTLYNSILYKCA